MGLSWAQGAEAQTAAVRAGLGAMGLGQWLNTVLNLSWGGGGGGPLTEAHQPGFC